MKQSTCNLWMSRRPWRECTSLLKSYFLKVKGGGHLLVTTKVKAMDATNMKQDSKDGRGTKQDSRGDSKPVQ